MPLSYHHLAVMHHLIMISTPTELGNLCISEFGWVRLQKTHKTPQFWPALLFELVSLMDIQTNSLASFQSPFYGTSESNPQSKLLGHSLACSSQSLTESLRLMSESLRLCHLTRRSLRPVSPTGQVLITQTSTKTAPVVSLGMSQGKRGTAALNLTQRGSMCLQNHECAVKIQRR